MKNGRQQSLGFQRRWFHGGFVVILFLVLGLCACAHAQTEIGPFEITGYYQFSANPSSGHINPNNVGLLDGSGAPNFLLLRQLLDLRIYGKFNES